MPGDKTSDAAVGSSVIAFLVAGVLFMASVVAVLVTTQSSSDERATGDAPDAAASRIQATNLANLLLESPGYAGGVAFTSGSNPGYSGQIANADELTRLGLLDPDSPEPFMMDFGKFQNLRLAPLAAANDDYVNYEEALRQFGLQDAGVNFHVRSYPNLRSTADILANQALRDDNLRVAYIADGTSHGGRPLNEAGQPPAVAALTCTAVTKGYRIATTVTNIGETPAQFEAIFNLRFKNAAGVVVDDSYQKMNTNVLAAETGSAQVFADTAALPDRSCNRVEGSLKIYDSRSLLREVAITVGQFAQPSPLPTSTGKGLTLDTVSESFDDSRTDKVILDYDGKFLAQGDNVILTICPGFTECQLGSDTTGIKIVENNVPSKDNKREFQIDDLLIGPDATNVAFRSSFYTARLYYNEVEPNSAIEPTGEFHATEYIVFTTDAGRYEPPNVELSPIVAGEYDIGAPVQSEVAFIESVMGKFCPYWYDSAQHSPLAPPQVAPLTAVAPYAQRCSFKTGADPHVGDIYPQDKQTLKATLERRLADFSDLDHDGDVSEATTAWTDLLVIGSNVDHNKLTSQDVKDTIGNWVIAGGTLIVFGSSEMSTHWLESVFHVAIESSSGGLNVPDQNHPVLNVPNDLDWPSYENAYAWRLKVTGSFDAENAFTRVVNEDGATPNAILAVSDPGGFQAGSVILTGWTPYDIRQESPSPVSPSSFEEGRNLVHNLLMLGYRDLYLDYGPSLPSKRTSDQGAPINLSNVVPEIRNAQICHPDFDDPATAWCDDPIPLRFEIYVF